MKEKMKMKNEKGNRGRGRVKRRPGEANEEQRGACGREGHARER